MNATKIDYLDFTWSPLVGCSKENCAVSAKCWAMYQAKRRQHKCELCYQFKPHTHFERLNQPLQMKTPKRIGVTFSADFWDKGFNQEQRMPVLNVVAKAYWHWFFNLTKQPQNIPNMEFPINWFQGTSICSKTDLPRIYDLWRTRAKFLALSVEPLYADLGNDYSLDDINWVIIGAQTHPLKLPKKEWVDSIIKKAHDVGIPVFIKNNLNSYGYNLKELPEQLSKFSTNNSNKTESNKQ